MHTTGRQPNRQAANTKTKLLLWLALASLVMGGASCGKKRPPAAHAETSPPAVAPAADADVSPAPASSPPTVTIAANPEGGADLKELNRAYVRWVAANHRRPDSFEEFAATPGLQIPPPPAGKKYVFDKSGFINVANR